MRSSPRRSDAKQHIERLSSGAIANMIRSNYNSITRPGGANSSSSRLQNLSKIAGDGNRGCKELMRRAGVIPSVFFEQARLEEIAALLSNENSFYYHHFGILGAGKLDTAVQLTDKVEILGYLAIRSLLVRRTKLEACVESNAEIDAFKEQNINLTDSLHLITAGEDAGWAIPSKNTLDTKVMKRRQRSPDKWLQGFLRNAITLAEVNRRLILGEPGVTSECSDAFSVAQLKKIRAEQAVGLTLINGKIANIGDLITFGREHTIDFGNQDVRWPNERRLEALVDRLNRELPIWIKANRVQLADVFEGKYGEGDDRMVAGGREGLIFHHLCDIQ